VPVLDRERGRDKLVLLHFGEAAELGGRDGDLVHCSAASLLYRFFCRFFWTGESERERDKGRERKGEKRGVSWKEGKLLAFSPSISLHYLKRRLTLVSLTETSLEPGRALLSMASSSASEGCCCGGGGEASSEAEEEVEVEKNDDDDGGDRSIGVHAAPLLLQAALRESAVRAAATREFIAAVKRARN